MNNESEKEHVEESTYCVFKVGEKEFLLPIHLVKEVVDASPLFPVPLTPEYVYGVIPLRGRIIPVIDLSKIYPTGKFDYNDAKLIIADVELELMREAINEHIGFLSETLPYFVSFSSDISSDDIIDVKSFFETFRLKELWYGRV